MTTKSQLIGIIAALAAICGCSRDEATCYRSVRADAISGSQELTLPGDQVSATVKVDFLLPVEDPLRSFVEENVAVNWNKARGSDEALATGYKAVIGQFLDEYKESRAERARKTANEEWVGPDAGWDFSLSGGITWHSEKYFSYRTSIMSYFGGVHPDVWFKNGTYSFKLGRRMTVTDIIDEKDFLPVVKIIRKLISEDESRSEYLRECMTNEIVGTYAEYAEDAEGGKGDMGEPCVSENFMIVEAGIVWTYNEYEISSYSEGHTDVLVPWHLLMPYLKSKDLLDDPEVVGVYERMRQQAIEEGRLQKIGGLEFF